MLKKLGKYELYRKLGAGATSTVYLGFDPFAQREVAIKVATPDVLADPEKRTLYTRFFLNEASLVGKLSHPHIAQIHDAVKTARTEVKSTVKTAHSEVRSAAKAAHGAATAAHALRSGDHPGGGTSVSLAEDRS